MNALTLPRFVLGNREAILRIAGSRWSLLCGILFVISAGFAREYDGESLLHAPWHFLRPLAASTVSGTLLFLLVAVSGVRKDAEPRPPGLLTQYRVFMSLFWMTAPLAWLYAIPYERFMDPGDAVAANLWTLALVAAWRVILMTRIISVLYNVRIWTSFFIVMLFADVVVFTAISLMPKPIIDFMGGVQHAEREAILAGLTFSVIFYSVVTAPIWLIGAATAYTRMRRSWAAAPMSQNERAGALLPIAISAVLIWLPVLLTTQPEQIRKHRVEELLRGGRVSEGIALMSEHSRSDFPARWEPPPRLGYAEVVPDLRAVAEAMWEEWPADWVADVYVPKIRWATKHGIARFAAHRTWEEIAEHATGDDTVNERVIEQVRKCKGHIRFMLKFDSSLSDSDREALKRLLEAAERALPTDEQ